jgi:hypothetical protein
MCFITVLKLRVTKKSGYLLLNHRIKNMNKPGGTNASHSTPRTYMNVNEYDSLDATTIAVKIA